MSNLRKLINERKELAERAARIVEDMRLSVRLMNGDRQPIAVNTVRIAELSPEEQAKVIRIR
jgi:hypothetical protein